MIEKPEILAGYVKVKTSHTILPHHIWIGSQEPS